VLKQQQINDRITGMYRLRNEALSVVGGRWENAVVYRGGLKLQVKAETRKKQDDPIL
jgi:hypothetical protein